VSAVADGLHTVPQSARLCNMNAYKSTYLQLWGTTHNPHVPQGMRRREHAAHVCGLHGSHGGHSEHGTTESGRSHHRIMKDQKNPPHPGAHTPRPHAHLFLTIIRGRGKGTARRRCPDAHAPSAVRVGHRGMRETRGGRIDPHQTLTGGRTSALRAWLTPAACALAGHPRDHLPPTGQRAGTAQAMASLGSAGSVHDF
jgi:hypothetical protein